MGHWAGGAGAGRGAGGTAMPSSCLIAAFVFGFGFGFDFFGFVFQFFCCCCFVVPLHTPKQIKCDHKVMPPPSSFRLAPSPPSGPWASEDAGGCFQCLLPSVSHLVVSSSSSSSSSCSSHRWRCAEPLPALAMPSQQLQAPLWNRRLASRRLK